MAKITKLKLKDAVKECLIEILQEGLIQSTELVESKASHKNNLNKTAHKRSHHQTSRTGAYNKTASLPPQQAQHQVIKEQIVSQMTEDPILADIFVDTAQTTLMEQKVAERGGPARITAGGDAAAHKASISDPQDLFGDSANNWAALAFPNSKK
tara:strand:+ start:2485 stop:2946 length:462 start_codon:yes stop_codon:yes gene_type:complete